MAQSHQQTNTLSIPSSKNSPDLTVPSSYHLFPLLSCTAKLTKKKLFSDNITLRLLCTPDPTLHTFMHFFATKTALLKGLWPLNYQIPRSVLSPHIIWSGVSNIVDQLLPHQGVHFFHLLSRIPQTKGFPVSARAALFRVLMLILSHVTDLKMLQCSEVQC